MSSTNNRMEAVLNCSGMMESLLKYKSFPAHAQQPDQMRLKNECKVACAIIKSSIPYPL